jgi:hypothetical protein
VVGADVEGVRSFATQRMPCVLVRVMAWEIATAMQLPRSVKNHKQRW